MKLKEWKYTPDYERLFWLIHTGQIGKDEWQQSGSMIYLNPNDAVYRLHIYGSNLNPEYKPGIDSPLLFVAEIKADLCYDENCLPCLEKLKDYIDEFGLTKKDLRKLQEIELLTVQQLVSLG